ncbi:MAG: GntR family transcriptional regulator [Rhodospirillaceae bacterium]|nr:GntR family transcriptional regulator [Rhodospirillaceae bacterium]
MASSGKKTGKVTLSAVERVVDSIRSGISSGRFMAGQRLIEADITADLKVSRSSVREAMRRLSAEGLLEIEHHKGARVRQMSRDEVLSLFETRSVLEGLAARLAARNIKQNPALRRTLVELRIAMQLAMKKGRSQDYVALNHEFHDALVQASGNPHLEPLVRQLQTPILRFQFRALIDLEQMQDSFQGHQKIIAGVLAGNESVAEREMKRHVEHSKEFIVNLPSDLFRR